MSAKYSKGSQNEVKKEMHRFKKGKAHTGQKRKKVKNSKQAIAIALSKARKKGKKVPSKKSSSTAGTRKKSSVATSRRKRTTSTSKKTAPKKRTKRGTTRKTAKKK